MKVIIFVMILALPGMALPPFEEPMESLGACQARANEATMKYMGVDDDFGFVAACRIQSKKADPA